jgi:hypothetical protein
MLAGMDHDLVERPAQRGRDRGQLHELGPRSDDGDHLGHEWDLV